MKIVTFNIRLDVKSDGRNWFENRKDLILEKLAKEQPDIICFQEVLPHVALWLKQNLKDYYVVGCGREPGLWGEQVSVAYRKERYNLMKMDTYWLSETPYVVASRYEDQSICPRTANQLVLEEMDTETVFRLVNVHLDHEGAGARRKGLEQILRTIKEEKFFPDIPVILAGDMNAEPGSEELKVVEENPQFQNVTKGIGITYHGFQSPTGQGSIDFIFTSKDFACTHLEKWTDTRDGIFLSDHYPVCVELCVDKFHFSF